jgi:Dyp-type peroxidase family
VDRILESVDPNPSLHGPLLQKLRDLGLSEKPAEVVRQRVLDALAADNVSVPVFPKQPDENGEVARWWLRLGAGVLGPLVAAPVVFGLPGLCVSGGLLAAAAAAVARFRYLELTDPQFQPDYSKDVHAFEVESTDENHFLQNQLTHLVRRKPGLLRGLALKLVFSGLQVRARYLYNKGKLGEIPSIHFARWVPLPHGDVLFLSNFDNSWQSYLGDFIDKASSGLTAVWSNTHEYPRTRWLLSAGSRDASRFLAWTRHNQLPSQVWYCAYPGLSIVNVNDNTEIRRGLADREHIDATDWLHRLRGVDRVHVDQIDGDARRADPALALEDIQGLVLWGYGEKRDARYLLLRVKEPVHPGLLPWLGRLPLHSAETPSPPHRVFVNVAFSHEGLRVLGVREEMRAGFSTAFVQDSSHEYRTRVNGDVGASDPKHWAWGSKSEPVHLVLFLFADDAKDAQLHAEEYAAQAEKVGLERVGTLEARTLEGRKEHFGFRDGIAQPTVQGSGRAELDGNTLGAGEFLLGHRDGYANVTHSPQSPNGFNAGLNGSYVVLRQLEQDVPAFWRHCAAQAKRLGLVEDDASMDRLVEAAVHVASKMVGRWPSGASLVRHPDADPRDPRYENEDNFTYVRNDEDNDRYGARCPFGAHVRRTNPRDWRLSDDRDEALELSNRHRIMRRGRPYGEPLDAHLEPRVMIERALSTPVSNGNGASNGKHESPRGLQFMCFNANIERQFEFIQQQWCNNPKFAGLANDPDPLLGLQQPAGELGLAAPGFTLQSDEPGRVDKRGESLGQFVKVVGSGYFFMPSIPAVRLLGARLFERAGVAGLEKVPPDEQLHIDSLIETLADKMKRDYQERRTLRDGHPKMHGCVSARFRVEAGLPDALRVGLFSKPATYRAWVRFSNESGTVSSDRKPDVRGVAIKLMGVPVEAQTGDRHSGYKLLEGEECCDTFDFLMTNRPAFFARDPAHFARMVRLLAALPQRLRPLAILLGMGPQLVKKLKRPMQANASPLEVRYFSGVPYLLGERAVKYSLRPQPGSTTSAAPTGGGDDHLRAALKATLQDESVSLDFLVQLRQGDMPIEDGSVVWDEQQAPFMKVATLVLDQQELDTPERREFGDNLSFNPWRCTPEHRPLGGLNRARRQVYRALSELRHGRNGAEQGEPVDPDAPKPLPQLDAGLQRLPPMPPEGPRGLA